MKPDAVPSLLEEIKGELTAQHLIVSIAAGVTIQSIEKVQRTQSFMAVSIHVPNYSIFTLLQRMVVNGNVRTRRSLIFVPSQVLGDGVRIIRVMPNTPCLVSKCASAFSPNKHATTTDIGLVSSLMSAVGITMQVPVRFLLCFFSIFASKTLF